MRRLGEVDLVIVGHARDISEQEAPRLRAECSLQAVFDLPPRGARGPWRVIRPMAPRFVDRLAHNLGTTRGGYAADPAAAAWIARAIAERRYAAVVARYLTCAGRAGLIGSPRTILDIDDLETAVYDARLQEPGLGLLDRAILRKHRRGLENMVRASIPRFERVMLASRADLDHCPHPSPIILPNIPWTADGSLPDPFPDAPDSRDILIIGSWNHGPNVQGLERFLAHSWPLVRDECPDARLRIVGSKMMEPFISRWASTPGVEVVGFVETLRDAYERCAFALSPVFLGGGTKIKVLEALSLGRTLVISRHSQRGFEEDLRHEESLLVAPDDRAMADDCVRLLRDPVLRARLAAHGRRVIEERYSFEPFARVVASVLQPYI
jgi:hypothetical protein